ncbi:hypothetical protein MMC10_011315 [Thelotrema lepadinum]|nr:hypothetical protein [Thelotrema lepadinum]
MEAILALSACLFCLLGYSVYSFKRNFDRVKHLNIPKVYNPLCPSNILWLLLQPALLPLLQLLPYDTRKWLRYSKWGWEYEDRYQTHAELGDVWMQVTPSMNWVYVADANLVNEIFHRREDFRRPRQLYSMLDIFGPNLGTVEGLDWQRHRKITGAAFNEQSYGIVWNESIRQADGVLQWWTSEEPHAINTTARDVRAVSLNILAFAGFRKQYPFDGKIENVSTQDAPSFRQTLCFVLDNSLLTMLIPAKLLRFPLLPSSWKQIGKAIDSLRNHMLIRYNEEKSQSTKESGQTENLMSVMVRASEEATYAADTEIKKSPSDPLAPKRLGLTMNEIFGNIFVYYFAGHDTTAAVFAYTMYLLAAYPDVQDWVTEELQQILPSTDDSPWLYEELFPRLKRCLALLLETIRLYDPIQGLPKWTGDSDRQIQYKGQSLIIPSRTFVLPSLMAVHAHPNYWGTDALSWRPARWIVSDPSSQRIGLETESVFTPARGTYFPWSDGQRNCPGKKFAQVEFVAVIARLLRRHRVLPERFVGESEAQAHQRVLEVVNDGSVKMLLQMRDPSRVSVRWVKRE